MDRIDFEGEFGSRTSADVEATNVIGGESVDRKSAPAPNDFASTTLWCRRTLAIRRNRSLKWMVPSTNADNCRPSL